MAATAKLFVSSPPGYGSLADSSTAVKVENDDDAGGAAGTESSVSFRDVTYTVSAATCRWKGDPKTILRSANGILSPGLNAIMGPTGSGKTTLLDILAARKDRSGLSGVILINGERQPQNFKCLCGYVTQDDGLMGTLTVRESLHFSAALRLPSHMTWQQRKERVERVIDQLGLRDCINTKIGTEFSRGVSGGERKRTSIGMELIIEPQVLFLDEPTTGLDARTAVSVVQLLRQLCTDSDRIIILSIHQPRYSIFKLFDTLTLLSRGDVVYHGPANMALGYFEHHGFACEEHENPADYFLDVISVCETQSSAIVAYENPSVASPTETQEYTDLVAVYQASEEYSRVKGEVDPMEDHLREKGVTFEGGNSIRGTYARNVLWQFGVVTLRSAVNILRSPATSILQVLNSIILAIVIGTVYIQSTQLTKDNMENLFGNKLGAIFLLVMGQVFGNLSAVDLFIRQRAIFIHENAGGYYRVSAYFFAKVVTDIIPLRLVPVCIYSVILYFMIGFQLDPAKFFIFLLALTLTSITGASIVFVVSAALRVAAAVSIIVTLTYVMSMLFAGFLVALSTLPRWIRWLKWLSMFKYGVEALAVNEFSGYFCYGYNNSADHLTFKCSDSLPSALADGPCDCVWSPQETDICCNGTRFLELRGFETAPEWIWWDSIALVCMIVLLMAAAYVALRLIKKEK